MSIIDRRRLIAAVAGAYISSVLPAAADAPPLVELPGRVPAPDFDLPDLAGVSHRLSDFRGQPVLVSFWAVWCAPCRRELPTLAALKARLRNTDIEILAVNMGDAADRIAAFLASHPAPGLPILLGGSAIGESWHVKALPTAYAVDAKGILRLGALGALDWTSPDIERQLRALDRAGPTQSAPTQSQSI
jgi:thiol-disulfide isomerase/thioredoxin